MIDLSVDDTVSADYYVPNTNLIDKWVAKTYELVKQSGQISIHITTKEAIKALNKQYRDKDKPTNVLSFGAKLPKGSPSTLLGDVILCAEVIEEEAKSQHKDLTAHWAHMVIHGTLHLLGYDHIEPDEAEEMESLEVRILTDLQFANPYKVQNQ